MTNATTTILDSLVPLLDAVAWPIVAFLLALLFRKPLADLIPFIDRIKFPGGEVRLGERLEKTKSQAERSLPLQAPPLIDERIQDITETYPRGAMVEAWLLIERELIDLATDHNVRISPSQRRATRKVTQALVAARVLDESLAAIVSDLQAIRNSVVHSINISPSGKDAQEYATTAARVVAAIREKRK